MTRKTDLEFYSIEENKAVVNQATRTVSGALPPSLKRNLRKHFLKVII